MPQGTHGSMSRKSKVKFNANGFRKHVYSSIVEEQTKRFEEYAKKELYKMASSHEFKNQTFNLEDSLLWCVYYRNELKSFGFYGSAKATESSKLHAWSRSPIDVNGRLEANKFVASYNPEKSNGWCVVWAAVAPYSVYLDPMSSHKSATNRFMVISQEYDEIRGTFAGKGNVSFITIG